MNEKLLAYLKEVIKGELKWMYHYETNDDMFGVETDLYVWCKGVVDGDRSIENLLKYFQQHYSKDERVFIEEIQKLM